MFGLFGKKIPCFQCDKKTKENETKFRRGFRFCSDGCVSDFVASQPLRPASGDQDHWREQAKQELGLAFGELASIVKIAGGDVSGGSTLAAGFLGGIAAVQAKDGVTDGYARYNEHLLRALPFLYALGLDERCAELETQDLDELYELSTLGAGPLQMRKVRNLVEPVLHIVDKALNAL